MTRPTFLVAALALSACGGQVAPAPGGTGTDQGSAGPTYAQVSAADDCVSRALTRDASGRVSCRLLEAFPNAAPCDGWPGLSTPNGAISAEMRANLGVDAQYPICELSQIPTPVGQSCATAPVPGWCYVEAAGDTCARAIRISPTAAPPAGTMVVLRCE